MKTAILTGFQPYGSYVINPTEVLARSLEGKVLVGHTIHSLVFPTTVLSPTPVKDYGKEIIEKASLVNASVIICLGMSSEVRGVRVETQCMNWVENDKYCTSFENRKPVFSDIPSRAIRPIPLERWDLTTLASRLSVIGINFETSEDAGKYCCNALIFKVLRALNEKHQRIPFLFAHIPCTEDAIAGILDFDRTQKKLILQSELFAIVEILLRSYQ